MTLTERSESKPSATTGLFATLRASLPAKGTGAQRISRSRPRYRVLVTLATGLALASILGLPVAGASAAVTHEFLPAPSEEITKGVPPSCASPCIPGPLGNVNALTTDGGHLWLAERTELGQSVVDEFNDSTGAFMRQLGEESGVHEMTQGVAVGDPGEEEVYVGAYEAGPVLAVFGANGKLQHAWTGANTPGGGFGSVNGVAVSANLATRGDVYVASSSAEPERNVVDVFKEAAAGGVEPALANVTSITGTTAGLFLEPRAVAVSSLTGDVVVEDGNVLDVFEPVGGEYAFLFEIKESPYGAFTNLGPIAVDGGTGDIYVVEHATNAVDEFSASGAYLGRLAGTTAGPFKHAQSVAVDAASHRVYVSDHNEATSTGSVDVYAEGQIVPDVATEPATEIGLESATLNGEVDPLEAETGEPASCRFAWGTSEALGNFTPCSAPVTGNTFVKQQQTLTHLTPDTTYYYRLQASNKKGENVSEEPTAECDGHKSQYACFTTPGPGIHDESVTNVAATSATLHATIDPHESEGLDRPNPVAYRFEYGPTTAYGSTTPAVTIGPGEGDVEVEQHIQGLSAGTPYHYRVVAVAEVETQPGVFEAKTIPGTDATFTTSGAPEEVLPDGRRWQLVSPADKHGALLAAPEKLAIASQATPSGNAITYLASLPTEASPSGFSAEAQLISREHDGSWSTEDISPPNDESRALATPYGFFSEDLSLALLQPFGEKEPNFSLRGVDFPEDTGPTQYVRHNLTCSTEPAACFEPLVTSAPGYANVPQGTTFPGKVNFEGATPDLTHIVLTGKVALTKTPTSAPELYEWAADQPWGTPLQLVSLLPDNGGPAPREAQLGQRGEDTPGAISADGSQIVWNEAGGGLYATDMTLHQTVRLDEAQGITATGPVSPQFRYASSDGTHVFFVDEQKLTPDSGAEPGRTDLYECTLEINTHAELVCALTDLTPERAGESAAVLGFSGATPDGQTIYFVANGRLRPGAVSGQCVRNAAISTANCNLYMWHDGSLRLVAVLSQADSQDWAEGSPKLPELTASASPNGQWFAFMSNQRLTGYDNEDVSSTASARRADQEVFLYNAAAREGLGEVVCASCDPTGARPAGVEGKTATSHLGQFVAGSIPGWSDSESYTGTGSRAYRPRNLSNEGRLFFNSTDALAPQDTNGQQDVYEFEPPDVGNCTSADPRFDSSDHGCVSLISSGVAAGPSTFLDASESGSHVFFYTAGRLSPQDTDTATDLYDAQICTAEEPCAPVTNASSPCATVDACRAATTPQPPLFSPPATATFTGAGNTTSSSSGTTKKPTRAQQLAAALKACHRDRARSKRLRCERTARGRYGSKPAKKAANQRGKR